MEPRAPSAGACEPPLAASSLTLLAWRRFRRNRAGVLGGALLAVILLAVTVGPWVMAHDPMKIDTARGEPPPHTASLSHPFGTDGQGRDILSRLLAGGRLTLGMSGLTVVLAVVVGAPLGLISGYRGGHLDQWVMRVMDIMLSFPTLLLALAIVAALGPDLINAVLAVAVVHVPRFARVVRSAALQERARDYVAAAEALGAGQVRILRQHLLPNCLAPLMVMATLTLATAILEISALSFLGLGARPPLPEWGAMLNEGRRFYLSDPHVMIPPGLAIVLSVLAINLLGDGLRDALDPQMSET